MARLSVLFSSSSGNCTYIRYGDTVILIDAGASAKRLTALLEANGVSPCLVKGIFITHEHIDHVKGVRVFADKYGIPVYANAQTRIAMSLQANSPRNTALFCPLSAGETVSFDGMDITPFSTSHDAADSSGYRIRTGDGRTASYVTDLGVFSDEVFEAVKGSDTVVLESNHDPQMLRSGPYPLSLQERILSDRGHLSNEAAAAAAVRLVETGTRRLILAHLSEQNNTPLLAAQTVSSALDKAGFANGRDYLLFVAAKEDGREYIY